MEDRNRCVLLKKKEYDELLKKAEANKPGYIDISFEPSRAMFGRNIESSIDLGRGLYSQILSISGELKSRSEKFIEKSTKRIKDNEKESIALELSKMNYFEIKRWIKENK